MEIERLLSQLCRKTKSVKFIISKLKEKKFPSESATILADVIYRVVTAIEDEILTRHKNGVQSVDDFKVQLKIATTLITYLGSDLRYIERAVTQHTPWSLIRPLERLAEQIHPNSYFIIRPQWSYNYTVIETVSFYRNNLVSFIPNDVLDNALKLDEIDDSIEKLYIIGFPYIERLNILFHVLIGHELGHPIEEEYFSTEDTNTYIPYIRDELLKPAILSELRFPSDIGTWDLFVRSKFNKILGETIDIRNKALAELICDLVNTNIFGLAALFATEEFVHTQEIDDISLDENNHYPPWRYRLRTIWEELTEPPNEKWIEKFLSEAELNTGVFKMVDEKLDSISVLVSQQNDIDKIDLTPKTRIAYQSIKDTLPRVREFIRKRLNQSDIDLNKLIGRTNRLLYERLEDWIPPDAYVDEDGKEISSDLISIVNLGWIRWLCSFEVCKNFDLESREMKDYFKQIDALNRLLLKASEYVDLRYSWEKNKVK